MRFVEAVRGTASSWAVIAALIAGAPAAFAQQPSPAALTTAKDIMKLSGAMALFNPLIPGVIEQAKNLYLQQNPALGKDLNEIAAKLRTDLAPRMDELTNEMAKLYATHFTEQELKDVLAFYRTPTGTKLLNEQPKIADEGLKFAQDWANSLSDKVMSLMRDELKKRGHSL